MVRLATRPRMVSGAAICTVAMLLAVSAISATPATKAHAAAAAALYGEAAGGPGAGDEIAGDRRADDAHEREADRVQRHRLHRVLARYEVERRGKPRRPVDDVGRAHEEREDDQHPRADHAE